MKKTISLLLLISFTLIGSSQTIINRDPDIKRMVDEISKERIEQHVRKMVSFQTRHNLSLQTDPSVGIGAAWNWIKSEMEKSIPASD